MGGPWDKYSGAPEEESGPWSKHGGTPDFLNYPSDPSTANANEALAPQGIQVGPMPSPPQPQMQQNSIPALVRNAGNVLPVAGGTAGAVIGAPAFGAGGLVGGALGAGMGETANLTLMNKIFGKDDPAATSKQGLIRTGLAMGMAGAAEAPGAILSTAGKVLLPKIAAAKAANQVGDAVEGFMQANKGYQFSKNMILRDIDTAARTEASSLRTTLANSNAQIDVDSVVQGARSEALLNNARVKGTYNQFSRAVETAKIKAGIPAGQRYVTPQQLFDFQRQLGNSFKGTTGVAGTVAKDLQKQLYRDAGQSLRTLSPEVDESLSRLTNFHAASSAVKGYRPGMATSLAVSAAQNPIKTAMLSPIAGLGVLAAGNKAKKALGNLSIEAIK